MPTIQPVIGPETKKAQENFPFSVQNVHLELFHAIAEVKIAAARANLKAGSLPKEYSEAIQEGCQRIIAGDYDDILLLPGIQGGAGTSINMAINELVADYASKLLQSKGINITIHPNDHVNSHQSTNDVNPTALKIAALRLYSNLKESLEKLGLSLEKRAEEFKAIPKLGRTHLQDAVPISLGDEFSAYVALCRRHAAYLSDYESYLCEVNLGGTAVGNKIWTTQSYLDSIYNELRSVTGLPLKPAENLMSQTSSGIDACALSAGITNLYTDLSKIATDLRILCSGPRGGLGEIHLQELQKGSSIMPGKVNPVIPESVNQIYFYLFGLNQSIHLASANSCLELNVMFPVIAFSLMTMLKLATEGMEVFRTKCIDTLEAVPENCLRHLDNSTALAASMIDELGYDTTTRLVREAIEKRVPFREILECENAGLKNNDNTSKDVI